MILSYNAFLCRLIGNPYGVNYVVCIAFPPVAAYGVNWGLLAVSPTGFITVDIYFVNGALQDESELGTMMGDMRSSQLRRYKP